MEIRTSAFINPWEQGLLQKSTVHEAVHALCPINTVGPRSMSRLVKMVLAALVILFGVWLAISGVLSFLTTKIGGMWVMTTEKCFFVPDIGGWIGRIWQAGVAAAGIVALGFGASWLFTMMKPDQTCACLSGRSYRQCCFRRERAYLIIGGLTVGVVAGARMLDGSYVSSIGIVLAAALAFWLVGRRYGVSHSQTKRA